MLSSLQILINNDNRINFNMGSILHGFLMEEIIRDENINIYHSEGIKTFSQGIYSYNDKQIWEISTLNESTYRDVILPILNMAEQYVYLKNKNINYKIESKILENISENELFEKYFFKKERYIKLNFITPTAFKSGGKYVNYPNLELIYKSIMSKYDNSTTENKIFDVEVIQELVKSSNIIEYKLRSTKFHLEKTSIPSFIGTITIKINASDNLLGLAHYMLKFGGYSSVGIKGALGMGRIKYIE